MVSARTDPSPSTAGHDVVVSPSAGGGVAGNLITDAYGVLRELHLTAGAADAPDAEPARFSPGFALPDLTPQTRRYFAAAEVRWQDLGDYREQRLSLLNLCRNPGTHTTKTFASLLIVARAVEHIRRTGEPVMIFSPTSGNKGTALRDAVERALACGLATPEQLRVAVVVPAASRRKLRGSALASDPHLAALNPVLLFDGAVAEDVKALGRAYVDRYAADLLRTAGTRLWYSLDLRNYLFADVGRALFEHVVAPVDDADRPRTHAHAVSSAFGLLGYHRGRELLEAQGHSDVRRRPHSLLVQHFATPDMVLHLHYGGFDRANLPEYRLGAGGLWSRLGTDPHFPARIADRGEVLDPTFYTHRPATAEQMTAIIGRHGGSGVVVSADECRQRYPGLRPVLEAAGFAAPDLSRVREWSLLMALTGVLNGIDRGLVDPAHDVVVHGSGWYTDDVPPLGDAAVREVTSAQDIHRHVAAGH